MPRQPYSVAVPSTGGRLHPLPFWKGRGLGSGLRPLQPGEGQVGQIQHCRAVTSSLFGQERGLVRDMELSLQERRRGRKVI